MSFKFSLVSKHRRSGRSHPTTTYDIDYSLRTPTITITNDEDDFNEHDVVSKPLDGSEFPDHIQKMFTQAVLVFTEGGECPCVSWRHNRANHGGTTVSSDYIVDCPSCKGNMKVLWVDKESQPTDPSFIERVNNMLDSAPFIRQARIAKVKRDMGDAVKTLQRLQMELESLLQ